MFLIRNVFYQLHPTLFNQLYCNSLLTKHVTHNYFSHTVAYKVRLDYGSYIKNWNLNIGNSYLFDIWSYDLNFALICL
jgi:hypothetical protein